MQQRIQADEGNLLARCEGVRRRETERFRDVSAQTSTLLQDLATSIGCSDDRWAVPPRIVRENFYAARKSDQLKPAPLQPPQLSPPPLLPPPPPPPQPPSTSSKTTLSGTQRPSQPGPVDESTPRLPVDIARVALGAAVEVGARACDEEIRDARVAEPAGLDGAELDRAQAGAREEEFVADISKAGPSSPLGGGPATEDHGAVHVRGCRGMEHEAQGGGSVQRRERTPTEKPDMHPGAEKAPFVAKEASPPTEQATTMASAATFLLARVDVEKQGLSARVPASWVYAEEEEAIAQEAIAHEPSPRVRRALEISLSRSARVDSGTEREGRALLEARAEGDLEEESRGGTVEDEWRRPVGGARPSPSGPIGLQFSSGTQGIAPVTLLTREEGAPSGSSHSVRPKARILGSPPEALPAPSRQEHDKKTPAQGRSARAERPDATTADMGGAIALFDRKSARPMLSAPSGDCSPAAARQSDARQGDTGRDVGDASSAKSGTGVAEGEGRPGVDGGVERRRSEDATEHLLREALRVKGLLANMDRADASTGDDGLGDDDPGRFLASLGLVEFKPLAGRLAEALERTPQAMLGDPAVAVPEPRTARGLRDQVSFVRVCCGCFRLISSSGDEL